MDDRYGYLQTIYFALGWYDYIPITVKYMEIG